MSTWTDPDLRAIGTAEEIRIAGRHADGRSRTPAIVWVVVADGAVYVRSAKGEQGQWYRGLLRNGEGTISWEGQSRTVSAVRDTSAQDAVDAAYRAKYGASWGVDAATGNPTRDTTLRLDPR